MNIDSIETVPNTVQFNQVWPYVSICHSTTLQFIFNNFYYWLIEELNIYNFFFVKLYENILLG